jgi:hypothetical protein
MSYSRTPLGEIVKKINDSTGVCEELVDSNGASLSSVFLTPPQVAATQALVSGDGISGATYDGSGRLTGYTKQGVAHVVSYPSSTTVVVSNSLGTAREVTLDSAGRVLAIA